MKNNFGPGKPTLLEYEELLEALVDNCCPDCGGPLRPIQMYPHSAGWPVEGQPGLRWLYKPCYRCGYDWAIWKLGVPRDYGSPDGEDSSDQVAEVQEAA